jgi:hypothetical protein
MKKLKEWLPVFIIALAVVAEGIILTTIRQTV